MDSSNSRKSLLKVVLIFVILTIVGVGLTVAAKFIAEGTNQEILMNLGSAIFSASLVFYLVEVFRWDRHKNRS